jgi:predicted transcriptional regulator
MKAAISIPDDVFGEGERLARRLKTSRSRLYAMALTQFVAQHDDNKITAGMNAVIAQVGTEVEPFSKVAARRVLGREKW